MKFLNKNIINTLKTLIKGSIIANILTILISPVVTRLYTPEDFGVYTLIITAISIFGPVLNLKYDMLIVKTKDDEVEFNTAWLSFIIGFILSSFISFSYAIYVCTRYNFNFIIIFLILLCLLLLTSLNNIFININNKNKEYKLISNVTIIRSIVNNLALVILGVLKYTNFGLIISQMLSLLSGVEKQSQSFRKKFNIFTLPERKLLQEIFLKNINFAIFTTPAAILTTSLYSSIVIFISYTYQSDDLGYYSLGYRILGIPFTIISANVAKVFYEKSISEINSNGNFYSTFLEVIKILLVVILPIMILIGILSPLSFELIFGKGWGRAGLFILYLVPMFTSRLIVESLSTAFILVNKQSLELKIQLFILITFIIFYVVTVVSNIKIDTFLIGISCIYSIAHLITLYIIYRLSWKSIVSKELNKND